jgi:ABC-type nitrate/sulfonate/bicarbonate transport system substrate-binding protein
MLVMVAAKIPIKIVSMNGYGIPMELVVPIRDKRTKGLKDLKGKKIGVGRGSEAYPVLIRLLNASRMRPTDVKIVQMSARNLTLAFKRKLVSAVFETRHFTTTLVARKEARVALNNKSVTNALGRVGASPLVVNADVVKRNPRDVQRFVNAWVRALAYIQQKPDDATRLMQIYFHRQGIKVVPKLARFWVRLVRYDRFYWTAADIKDAEYNAWGLKTGRILKVAPKLKGYIDNRFAKKAFAAIKKK